MTPAASRINSWLRCRVVWLLLWGVFCSAAIAQEPMTPQGAGHRHHVQGGPSSPASRANESLRLSVPDVMVWTQEGSKVRFYSDLVQDRVVAINFIFTTCTTICPPLAATFSKMQDLLGDRLGRDVHLISVSVDPTNDTPDRLRAWGQKFRARPGWTFVTGPKAEMDRLLRALDAYTAQKENHSPIVLIGNDRKKRWTRAYGLAPASTLAELIQKESAASPEEMDKQESKPK